ncbi:hypothetical protein OKW49_008002 [Paraburkholderia youngii]
MIIKPPGLWSVPELRDLAVVLAEDQLTQQSVRCGNAID